MKLEEQVKTYSELISSSKHKSEPIKIEIGCGQNKKEGHIGIDLLKMDGVDIVHDINDGLPFIESNSVDYLYTRHTLEHIVNLEKIISEIHRVLKVNTGVAEIIVPHFSNPHYYSDYTHKNFFGLYSFCYFSDMQLHKYKRYVPTFYNNIKFEIKKIKLEFRSQFFVVQLFKRAFTRLVNLSPRMQEFYEENLSNFVSCSEIKYLISAHNKE